MFKNESVLEAAVGSKLLDRAIYLANFTKGEGLYFVLEHPSTAASWRRQNLKALIGMDGVYTTTFDQCMYGLKSKVFRSLYVHLKKTACGFSVSCCSVCHIRFERRSGKIEHECRLGHPALSRTTAWTPRHKSQHSDIMWSCLTKHDDMRIHRI